MARTSLNFPAVLKEEAERLASGQGVSLNQFVVWAVAEKVGGLKQRLSDPRFPRIAFWTGAAGWPVPVIRGTHLRVQTLVVASRDWKLSVAEIAGEYSLTEAQVQEALAFYEAHQGPIDGLLAEDAQIERRSA